jgi:hypothetical protein
MFRKFFVLVIAAATGAGLMHGAYNWHIVRTKETWIVVAKSNPTLVDIYADVRGWDANDWTKHSKLSDSLIRNGHGDLITGSVIDKVVEEFTDPFDDTRAPDDEPRE